MKNNLKKKIVNSYQEQYGDNGVDINVIKSRLMFKTQEQGKGEFIMSNKEEKKNPQKRSHLATWLSLALVVVALTLVVIFIPKGSSKPKGEYQDQVVTVSVNPSVSLATDENGIVVGVYGDNDEGKMIIEGEELTGVTLEVAMDRLFEIEVKCGYFVKADDPKYNNVTISVSGKASPELEDKIAKLQTEAVQSLEKLGIEVQNKVTMVKNDAHKALVQKAIELDKTLDEATVNEKTDDQIVALIASYYLEASKFPTKELEELYNNFKDSEIKLANVEAINEMEGGLKTLNTALQNLYKEAQTATRTALANLEAAYNTYFVNSDSEFQKAYAKVKEAKAEVIKLRAEVANLEEGADKSAKEMLLATKEAALSAAELVLNTAKETAKAALDTLNVAVNKAFAAIDSLIVSNEDLQKIFDTKKAEVDDYLNTTKDKMFENFEAKYKTQIETFAENVATQKTNLINSLKEYAK